MLRKSNHILSHLQVGIGWTLLAAFYLYCSHILLADVIDLNHDEAWAFLHSWKIAFQDNFWPFEAMSPQSHSWTHYWTAGFFKIFGVSEEIFRLSYNIFNLFSAWLIYKILSHLGRFKEAQFAPLVFLFFPSWLLLRRFSIEIVHFQVFASLLVCYLSLLQSKSPNFKKALLIAGILFIGLTSHFYFVAFVFSWVGVLFLKGENEWKKFRWSIVFYALLVLPVLFLSLDNIRWPAKLIALIVAHCVLLIACFTWTNLFDRLSRIGNIALGYLQIASLFVVFNSVILLSQYWLWQRFSSQESPLMGASLVIVAVVALGLLTFLIFRKPKFERVAAELFPWSKEIALFLLISSVVMAKHASRYYLVFIPVFAFYLCHYYSYFADKKILKQLGALVLIFSIWGLNFIEINGSIEPMAPRKFSALSLRGFSGDFMRKSEIASILYEQSCEKIVLDNETKGRLFFALPAYFKIFEYEGRNKSSKTCPYEKLKITLSEGEIPSCEDEGAAFIQTLHHHFCFYK